MEKSRVDMALDELICPLCIGTFTDPRSLQCLHSYCEGCLAGLQKASQDRNVLSCPECRAETILSADGVKALPMNFKLKRFVEILTAEERKELIRKGTQRNLTLQSKPTCTVHHDKPLEYFCESCDMLICGQCMIDSHRIHGEVKYATDILEKHVLNLKEILPDMDKVAMRGQSTLKKLQSEPEKLMVALGVGISEAQSYFNGLREILQEREKLVVDRMKLQARRREKLIQKHSSALAQALEGVEKSKQTLEDVVERRSGEVSVLMEEERLRSRIHASMRLVEEEILDTKATQDEFSKMTPFVSDPKIEPLCRSLTYSSDVAIRSKRYSSGGVPCDVYVKQQGSDSPSMTKVRVKSMSQGQEDFPASPIKMRPSVKTYSGSELQTPGKRLLALSLVSDSSDVRRRSSPVLSPPGSSGMKSFDILEPISEVGTKNLIGPYNKVTAYPCGVYCTTEGTLLVSDSKHHLYRIITSTGKCLETVGSEGKGDGQFFEPTGITMDKSGHVFIVDGKSPGRLQKFSIAGKFLSKFKVRGLTSGPYMAEPIGVVVLSNGNILVSDGEKACIHMFDESGKYQGRFGNITYLKYPAGIAASGDRIILADKANHCIFILTLHGQLLARVGKQGSLPGELHIPYGVAFDKQGNIVVSECGNHRISIFTPGGSFMRCFGGKGSELGMFRTPRHICFNHQGNLVVSDEQNQRLQVFDLSK